MVALWGGIGALAVATGPSFGAVLITAFGWRSAFFVNLPVGAGGVGGGPAGAASSPRSSEARPAPDYLGVVLVAGALAALVLAISQGPTWGWSKCTGR